MKVRGFGAWPSRNVTQGGRRNSFDEYNKAFKGAERFPRAEEYASRYVEEYHHYQEQQDLTVEQDDQKLKKNKKKDSQKSRQRMIQQFMALVAGSVMIASAYSVAVAKRAQQPSPDNSVVETLPSDDTTDDSESLQPTQDATSETTAVTEQKWKWSSDRQSATLIITDSSGKVVGEIEADVTTAEEPANCNTDGKLTYTASASWEEKTYSDTRFDVLPALGHEFDDGTETILDDGNTAMDFECTRCHEHFIVQNSITEE